jgi:hypothetical protein
MLTAVLAVMASSVSAGRYIQLTKKAARGGGKYACHAATFFGHLGHEEFTAVGKQSDGSIVAFGNTWGPTFPDKPKPTVLGKGKWYEISPWNHADKVDPCQPSRRPDGHYPNRAGMIVTYAPDLKSIRRVVKFDWSVATISTARVDRDDGLIIAGTCTRYFRKWARSADALHTVPAPENVFDRRRRRRIYGPVYYRNIRLSGDSYVAKLSPDGRELQWVWLFEGHRSAPGKLWVDHTNAVWFDLRGMKRISADGSELSPLEYRGGGRVRLLAVSKQDGRVIVGGDVNSGTGREPWRKPILQCYDANAHPLWQAYSWDPALVGHDEYRLVSDSSCKGAMFDENGKLLVVGWSDGGNSCLTKSPIDLDKHVPNTGMGFSTWNAGVLGVSYFIRMDPDTFQVSAFTPWVAYVHKPDELDVPNTCGVRDIAPLADDSLAVHGGAATGLIQTPNAFVKLTPATSVGYGGSYVTVFSKDFRNMRFSSYTPGLKIADITAARSGVVVVGRATRGDRRGNPPPSVNAITPEHQQGYSDAHILLLAPAGKENDQ